MPDWIRSSLSTNSDFVAVSRLVHSLELNTVCEDAKCPNRHECWSRGTATVMILGEICTRACRFCSVGTGKPLNVDFEEPGRVADAAKGMGLKHIVVTSVDRDDLPDGGASIWAETITALHQTVPGIVVEVLTGDFNARTSDITKVLDAKPNIFSHNLETVKRLQSEIRPQANYGRSLSILKEAWAYDPDRPVKSGMMLGLGESEGEVTEGMEDLYSMGCRILTLGQYLRPTRNHIPVQRYVDPEEFARHEQRAHEIGFIGVASGPMVRSSYKAETLYEEFRTRLNGGEAEAAGKP
jgi:lipoic acid synthetase